MALFAILVLCVIHDCVELDVGKKIFFGLCSCSRISGQITKAHIYSTTLKAFSW